MTVPILKLLILQLKRTYYALERNDTEGSMPGYIFFGKTEARELILQAASSHIKTITL